MRALAVSILLVVAAAGQTPRSVTVARGAGVVHAEPIEGGLLLVQAGFELSLLSFDRDEPVHVASLSLPLRAKIWDRLAPADGAPHGEVVVVTDDAVMAAAFGPEPAWRRIAAAGDLFQGRLSAPPLRRRFVRRSADGIVGIVPELAGLRLFGVEGTPLIDAPAVSEQSLGWGLGYVMSSRLTVPPFFVTELDARPGADVLYRKGDELRVRTAPGSDVVWASAPAEGDTKILGFDHHVPPLETDADGDGLADLVLVDPGGGRVFCYLGKGRAGGKRTEPDQVLQLSGWVLSRWLIDADGDGASDLVLLGIPRLSLLDQLTVVKKREIPVELSIRRRSADGSFARSPWVVERFKLPTRVSLTRNKRNTSFRVPVFPFREGAGFALLAPDDGALTVRRLADRDFSSEPLPWTAPENDAVGTPFTPKLADLDGDGRTDFVIRVEGAERSDDRVVVIFSGKK